MDILTVCWPSPRIYVIHFQVLWSGTNSIWMPSCKALYFVHNDVRSPLAAIQTHHQHRDCAKHIDPNMGNDHLHSFQYNERLMVPPIRRGNFWLDKCHFYIHAGFCSPMCTAIREYFVVQLLQNYRRCSQSLQSPNE